MGLKNRKKRTNIKSTPDRLRLSVFRSNTNLVAQIIDDTKSCTVVSVSTLKYENGGNTAAAIKLGETLAEAALKEKITALVFDRGAYRFTGRIKAFVDSVNKHGVKI